MPLRLACAFAGLLAAATCATAVELRPVTVRKGVEGLDPAPLSVINGASGPIVCVAGLAHWYSLALGRAPAGETLHIPLWRDYESGAVVALNDNQENMPVEALWCGLEGRSYETRAVLRVERVRRGPLPRAVTCREEGGRLICG